jgi:hypothetical protein
MLKSFGYPEFARRFRDHHEIGREATDTHLLVFYDNGREVGLWREDRRTTRGTGRVLGPQDAEMARYWYRTGVRKWADAASEGKNAGTRPSPFSPEARR